LEKRQRTVGIAMARMIQSMFPTRKSLIASVVLSSGKVDLELHEQLAAGRYPT
jgi:hypothetical protein